MTIEETYPLHRCIFQNDVVRLNEILKDEEIKKKINEKDNHGNTPIHLALMLDRRNCILALLKNGCDCVSRNNYGWNPSEEATMLGDIDLVEKLSYQKYKSYFDFFGSKEGIINKWNDILPEFHIKYRLKFKSKIPILEKLGIKDIEHFYKKGNNFRMDFGFSGVDFRGIPRLMKGSLTVLLFFREDGKSTCYLLDNKAKLYTELFPNPSVKIQEAYCNTRMNVKTMYKFYNDNSQLKIKKKSNSGFGFNKSKKRTICINGNKKYSTDIYKFKDSIFFIRKRDNEHTIGDYKSHIKTTITDLDKSRNYTTTITDEIKKTLLNESDYKLKNITNEYIKANGVSENDSDSDNDDSDIESDANSESVIENHQLDSLESNNNFRNMVDENIYSITEVNSEISHKIVQMIICGSDEKGNLIEKDDILYIRQLLPSFFTSYLKANYLPEDQQKKLEEIYTSIVGKYDLSNTSDYNAKHKNPKNVYNVTQSISENYYKKASLSNGNTSKNFKNIPIKREPITEEEYFDSKNMGSLHLGRVMEISEEKKLIENVAKFWLTKENTFPLNCYHIKPIIDTICLILFDQINIKPNDKDYDREIYYNIINYIYNEVDGSKRFPLKFEIPIYASTVFQSKLLEVETENIPDDIFKIPDNYSKDSSVGFRFIK
ncbi:hypothetical protein BCR36DRAFT_402430 [Piromyces finnis]|uniref:Uncharacterized protein n=1 Tax=Piromyces finnis TaxID=1754191 RepID=A0A1Y1VIR1_9FUNG|nr:hypothetical protein BCR36DRAFT_402430 [Piromyces finnis]|eukprot:ORX57283.1 hypothetical protein BCR36DRAFT_402430 [Piromyces finnis]